MIERRRKETRQPQYESKAYASLVDRLAANVQILRNANGWSQLETSQKCGMALYQYQRVESGITNVTFTTLARLMNGFDVDIHTLFQDEDATKFIAVKSGSRRRPRP